MFAAMFKKSLDADGQYKESSTKIASNIKRIQAN